MNNKPSLKMILLAGLLLIPASAGAGFIDPGWGARGAGKGGAFTATADDASALLWNPAALSYILMKEASFSYDKPYAGLDGVNIGRGYFAAAYPVFGVANFGAAVTVFNGDGLYRETVVMIGGAREISDLIPAIQPMSLSAGISLKYLSSRYFWDDKIKASGDPVTSEDGASAFTADIGLLFQPVYEIPVGLTVKNIIPADVGVVKKDTVPMEIRLGAAYRLGALGVFDEVTPEIMLGYRAQDYDEGKISYAAGVEAWMFLHTVGLRLGFNNNEVAVGAGYERVLGDFILRIDYAALISTSLGDNFGSHRISTNLRF